MTLPPAAISSQSSQQRNTGKYHKPRDSQRDKNKKHKILLEPKEPIHVKITFFLINETIFKFYCKRTQVNQWIRKKNRTSTFIPIELYLLISLPLYYLNSIYAFFYFFFASPPPDSCSLFVCSLRSICQSASQIDWHKVLPTPVLSPSLPHSPGPWNTDALGSISEISPQLLLTTSGQDN